MITFFEKKFTFFFEKCFAPPHFKICLNIIMRAFMKCLFAICSIQYSNGTWIFI